MKARNASLVTASSILIALAASGCDPEGPGASGTLSLGAAIDPTPFQSLEIRGFPDSGATFDPKAPFTPPGGEWQMGTPVRFPFSYKIGQGLGTTPTRDWRLVAWLTKRPGANSLDTGDIYCTVKFSVDKCGAQFGDYCGVKSGVDCTLGSIAP